MNLSDKELDQLHDALTRIIYGDAVEGCGRSTDARKLSTKVRAHDLFPLLGRVGDEQIERRIRGPVGAVARGFGVEFG